MLGPMRWPIFFHRQEIWIPTIPGGLVILFVCAGACLLAVRHVHSFLAPNESVGARLLIIEGWMAPDQLDQGLAAVRNGGYNNVITVGSTAPADLYRAEPVPYAELARDYLVRHGLPGSLVTAVPVPESAQDRTYLNAVMIRGWLQRSGRTVDAIDVFSSGVHSRRSRMLYRTAFGPHIRVGILAARPSGYDPDAWWATSVGAKSVLSEAISWVWTALFFHPGAPGSHEETWGEAKPVPNSMARP